MARAARDARFRQRLLTEVINQLLVGDLDAGKVMLRDYFRSGLSRAGDSQPQGGRS